MLRRGAGVLGMLVLAAGLAGCEPKGPAPLPPVGEARVALETRACEARGGTFLNEGGLMQCRTQPRDGGKACRIGTDCEGACLARSMTCAPITPLAGCNEVITNSGARVTECVE